MAASPHRASGRTSGNMTGQTGCRQTSRTGAQSERRRSADASRWSCADLVQCLEAFRVPRQGGLSVVAKVAFAPVRAERRFDMAIAAFPEFADLAVHFPRLQWPTHRAAEGALEKLATATRAGFKGGHPPWRAVRVGQECVRPAIQVAQSLVGGHARQRHHLRYFVGGEQVAFAELERALRQEIIRAQLSA